MPTHNMHITRAGTPRGSRHPAQRCRSPLYGLLLALAVCSAAGAQAHTPPAHTPDNHSPAQTTAHTTARVTTQTTAPADRVEQQAVTAVIELYFRGHASGQAEFFRQAFHADARLSFIRDGVLTQWPASDYIARAGGQPAEDEAQRRRHIDLIDISGSAAIAKVTLDYPQVRFTDYLSLLKTDGRWQIISKTFHVERR